MFDLLVRCVCCVYLWFWICFGGICLFVNCLCLFVWVGVMVCRLWLLVFEWVLLFSGVLNLWFATVNDWFTFEYNYFIWILVVVVCLRFCFALLLLINLWFEFDLVYDFVRLVFVFCVFCLLWYLCLRIACFGVLLFCLLIIYFAYDLYVVWLIVGLVSCVVGLLFIGFPVVGFVMF